MSEPNGIPDPETFRTWLVGSLTATKTSATALAREVGLGPNGVTQFLRHDGRDVRLGTANKIEVALRARATAAGLDLPKMPVREVSA